MFVPSLLLILAIVVIGEVLLHVFPHEKLYKSRWMDNNAEEVQVLVLGSSNTNRAIMPSELGLGKGFSCAGPSQDLHNDSWILHRYIERMDSLRYVVVDMNYLTPFLNIDYDDSYAVLRKRYRIYWGNRDYAVRWWEWPEVSRFNWLAWYKDFVAEKDPIYADGFMSRPSDKYNEDDWRYYAWMTASDHTMIDDSNASRMEDPAEAARIDDRIASMWQGHPHWRHIPSRESFEEKADYLLEEVLDFLDTK